MRVNETQSNHSQFYIINITAVRFIWLSRKETKTSIMGLIAIGSNLKDYFRDYKYSRCADTSDCKRDGCGLNFDLRKNYFKYL